MPGRGRAIEPLHRTQLCRRNAHTLWLVILFDPAGGLDSNSLSWFILLSGPKPLLDPPNIEMKIRIDRECQSNYKQNTITIRIKLEGTL